MFEFLVVGAFGSMDKLEEMYEIQNLGVTPEKQGRGYGTALVRTVLDMVSTFLSRRFHCLDRHDSHLYTE